MKLSIATMKGASISSVMVEHGSQSLEWSTASYDRSSINHKERFFENANAYLQTLDKETQGRIWLVYADIREALYSIDDFAMLRRETTQLVTRLYALLDVDAMRNWCKLYANFVYPDKLPDDYLQDHPKDLTYRRVDYKGLLFLSVALRFMMPIWGESIRRNKLNVSTVHKEYVTSHIIGQSELFDTPEMEKLRDYISANIGSRERISPTAIHSNLGSSDRPDWLLSLIMIRRLTIAESVDPEVSIISNIYNFLISNIDIERFGSNNRVIDRFEPGDSDIEDNVSVAENIRIAQHVPDSAAVVIGVYVDNYREVARRVQPDIPMDLVDACVQKVTKEASLEIETFRVNMVGIIVSDIISIRSLHSLNNPTLQRLVGVSQAVLYHTGFHELAHLITAEGKSPDLSSMHGTSQGTESRSRLTRDNVAKLMELYPFYRRSSSRATERGPKDNVAIVGIEEISKHTQVKDWFYRSPGIILGEHRNGEQFRIPGIKNQLAELILSRLGATQDQEVETV